MERKERERGKGSRYSYFVFFSHILPWALLFFPLSIIKVWTYILRICVKIKLQSKAQKGNFCPPASRQTLHCSSGS